MNDGSILARTELHFLTVSDIPQGGQNVFERAKEYLKKSTLYYHLGVPLCFSTYGCNGLFNLFFHMRQRWHMDRKHTILSQIPPRKCKGVKSGDLAVHAIGSSLSIPRCRSIVSKYRGIFIAQCRQASSC